MGSWTEAEILLRLRHVGAPKVPGGIVCCSDAPNRKTRAQPKPEDTVTSHPNLLGTHDLSPLLEVLAFACLLLLWNGSLDLSNDVACHGNLVQLRDALGVGVHGFFFFRGALLRVLGRRGLEFWGSCVWCLRGLSLGPEGSGV